MTSGEQVRLEGSWQFTGGAGKFAVRGWGRCAALSLFVSGYGESLVQTGVRFGLVVSRPLQQPGGA
jgi:hypothetical protein